MEYAVIEWNTNGVSDEVRVVAEDQTEDNANMIVTISPIYYTREVVTMQELQEMRDNQRDEI